MDFCAYSVVLMLFLAAIYAASIHIPNKIKK